MRRSGRRDAAWRLRRQSVCVVVKERRQHGGELLVEELVGFKREPAQQIDRRPNGNNMLGPVVETVQACGVCSEVIPPVSLSAMRVAGGCSDIALAVFNALDVTVVHPVEHFETNGNRVLINELAMRAHSRGYWIQDGSLTSQVEQRLRSVFDLSIGAHALKAPVAVMLDVRGGPDGETYSAR